MKLTVISKDELAKVSALKEAAERHLEELLKAGNCTIGDVLAKAIETRQLIEVITKEKTHD